MSMKSPPIFASSGFGIHVGQYTGAWMRFASACHPPFHAAGQPRATGALDAAETRAASASAATPATIEALMRTGYRAIRAALDLGRWAPHERREVTGVDDHGVAPGPLELPHLVRRRDGEVRDRELARRDGREQVEHHVERRLVVLFLDGGEQEDVRIDPVERLLELLLVADLHGDVEPELDRAAVQLLQPAVVLVERVEDEHDRVGGGRGKLERDLRAPEDRQRR